LIENLKHNMNKKELFSFTCFVNPPTKNEQKYLGTGMKRYKNPKYFSPWKLITLQMELKKCKVLTKEKVILSVWNGFKKIDIANFLSELEDRLQGIVYYNDRQIKEEHLYKLDNEKKEFFKVIVELLE
jgi:Holliday junction resolvase RusA-like endonuclease